MGLGWEYFCKKYYATTVINFNFAKVCVQWTTDPAQLKKKKTVYQGQLSEVLV